MEACRADTNGDQSIARTPRERRVATLQAANHFRYTSPGALPRAFTLWAFSADELRLNCTPEACGARLQNTGPFTPPPVRCDCRETTGAENTHG
jgi:hypothetical protein